MNYNLRTAALVAAGIVSAGSAALSEEAKMNPVETALTATTISGYVSTSAFFDLSNNDLGTVRLPGRSFDGSDKLNKINLDVVKLSLAKPLSEGDWSAGYQLDLLFGPDANTYATTSSPLGVNSSDFGIKQAYVTLQAPIGNGLVAKAGVFDTVIGYEVFESASNPNYSRSYGYFIEPTEHTGLLLSYKVAEWLSVNAGIADSYNARINAPGVEGGAPSRQFGLQTYMGSVVLTAPKGWGFLEGANAYLGVVHGVQSNGVTDGAPGDPNFVTGQDGAARTSLYGGITLRTPVDNLAVGIAYDYRFSEIHNAPINDPTTPGGVIHPADTSQWATAIGGYVTYQATKQMKLALRGEYAAGTGGTWSSTTTGQEEYFGLTTTLDYSLWENVITRLEFRWDSDLSNGRGNFGTPDDPSDNAYTLGVNLVYKF